MIWNLAQILGPAGLESGTKDLAKEPISTEAPIGDDEDSRLNDFIEDGHAGSPIEPATATGTMETVRDVLAAPLCHNHAHTAGTSPTTHLPFLACGPIAQWSEQGTHRKVPPRRNAWTGTG